MRVIHIIQGGAVVLIQQRLAKCLAWALLTAGLSTPSVGFDDGQFQLVSSHLSWDWSLPPLMTDRLREVAGNGAVDCGRVHVGQDPALPTTCALAAFAAKKAFCVRYDIQGNDSDGAVGLAADETGKVYAIGYDRGWGSEGFPITVLCSTPHSLVKTPHGRLSCSLGNSGLEHDILRKMIDADF